MMYLKSLKIKNFRKFGTKNNKVEFVDSKSYMELNKGEGVNIAPTTTLIVGKNNSGKTTVIKALDKLINNKKYSVNDFNYSYLRALLGQYEEAQKDDGKKFETPSIEFKLTIGLTDESGDLVTNLVPFMTLSDVSNSELEILIKYELRDEEAFNNQAKGVLGEIKEGVQKHDNTEGLWFRSFFNLIDSYSSNFTIKYYNASGEEVKFNINDLIELKTIQANNIESDKSLSNAFSKIIEYRHKSLLGNEDKEKLETIISTINHDLTSSISEKHTNSINDSLGKIESPDKLQVLLSSDLTFKRLMGNLIKYEYVERGHNIPENQFGLGYTNLMMIIADLIEYMERYPEQSFNSKINLISIEEPETFMHPQMQELFIKHINEAISSLLQNMNKNVNSQLIITTHSSHILNSKIHSGNTFNNINYIATINDLAEAVILNDDKIKPDTDTKEKDLQFLKKHIKYKVSELFFSDAIIFVEGITEETLLRYYIDKNNKLNKYYISIFNIDGAHGLVYHEIIKLLKVPTFIITDLDIKRSDEEKEQFKQINSLAGKTTTNATIKKYHAANGKLDNLTKKIEDNNMLIAYQGEISGHYATSFEEAFILTNHNNVILNSVLKKTKPRVYKEIVGEDENKDKIKINSYKLQAKLSDSKSKFSNDLLYALITANEDIAPPELPEYISEGLEWLTEKLEGENK